MDTLRDDRIVNYGGFDGKNQSADYVCDAFELYEGG